MWKGTAAILKPRPTRIRASPTHSAGLMSPVPARAALMSANFVTPIVLYSMLTPKRRMAEEKAPMRIYLMPASLDLGLYRAWETRM